MRRRKSCGRKLFYRVPCRDYLPEATQIQCKVLSVQTCESCVTKTVYDKKHRNAVARYLFDSCWDHYAFSRSHWRNRNGDLGAHNRHFDLSRQVVS